VGVGGIGGVFAAHLARRPDVAVELCVRQSFDRLVVEGLTSADLSLRVVTDPADIAPVDYVLLATKSHQTSGTAAWLASLVGPDTTVVVLQNGIDHEHRVASLLGRGSTAAVVPALVYIGAHAKAPGRISHDLAGETIVPDTEGGREVAALLAGTGLAVTVRDDFERYRWLKLAANVAASSLTTLHLLPARDVATDPALRHRAAALIDECVAVAAAMGVPLGDGVAEAILSQLAGYPPDVTSSMCRDRLAGRPLELDALLSVVVRHGQANAVATPAIEHVLDELLSQPVAGSS
jgi:2-dehydropantoate 2-reductase